MELEKLRRRIKDPDDPSQFAVTIYLKFSIVHSFEKNKNTKFSCSCGNIITTKEQKLNILGKCMIAKHKNGNDLLESY